MFFWQILMWPCNEFRRIQWQFKRATPFRKFEMMRNFADKVLRISGIRVLSDCVWKWLGIVSFVYAIQFVVFALYTTYYYWNTNIISAIQPYTLMAIVISGWSIAYPSFGPNRYRYRALALFAGKNIFKDRHPTTVYERKCDEIVNKLLVHVVLSVALAMFSNGLMMAGPAYVFLVKKEYVTPTGVIVPFMDPSSGLSFIINMSIQFSAAFICTVDTIGLEIANSFIINSYTAMTELVCLNMRTFSDELRAGHFTYQQERELRQIIVQLQDIENYINELNDLFYWRMFTHPVLTTWCVSLGIFSQMTNGFPAGYGFASTIYIQFLVICFMGNEMKRSCDQIVAGSYEIKWYLMPPQYQKMIATVMHRWQAGCNITIGPFEELNYETASNITKKIYTVFMLLRSNITE